jgi:hypothetical protein
LAQVVLVELAAMVLQVLIPYLQQSHQLLVVTVEFMIPTVRQVVLVAAVVMALE